MNKPYIAAIIAITRLAFSSAIAHTMPIGTHKIVRRNCHTDFIAETKKCNEFSDRASGGCLAVAKNTEKFEASETHTLSRPPKVSACGLQIACSRYDYSPAKDLHCNLAQKCIVCTKSGSAAQLNCHAAFF